MKKLLVILLVLGLAAPVMAAEWNWSGTARVNWAYYQHADEATSHGNGETDMWFQTTTAGVANIRSRIKASDTISAFAELGIVGGNGEEVKFRQLFGRWNFGAGNMVVGHTTLPHFTVITHSIMWDDHIMLKDGQYYMGRRDQVKFEFGGLVFALATLDAEWGPNTAAATYAYTDEDQIFPLVDVAYTFRTKTLFFRPFANFQTYSLQDNAADESVSITSASLGLRWKVNFGPGWVGGDIFGAQNPAQMHILMRNPPSQPGPPNMRAGQAHIVGTDVNNAIMVGGQLGVGFKFTDMLGIEAGLGYWTSEVEVDAAGTELKDDSMNWYLQLPVTLAKGVDFTAEVGQVIYGDVELGPATTDQGETTYIATRMQIRF